MKNIEQILTEGLQQGFGGGTVRQGVTRGGFELESSALQVDDGRYHDEWLANRVGGGQELVEVGGKKFTRLYSGGTVSEDDLKVLGITKKEVIRFLKYMILQLGERLRLFSDFEPEFEGDWQYSYKVIDQESEIPTTAGKETIRYKGKIVFVHYFLLCPVE